MPVVIAQQQESGTIKEAGQSKVVRADEVIAFCPKCKTFETLWFTSGVLEQTRKFSQEGARLYHDCGSNEPCRLFARFSKKTLTIQVCLS
jgi:hypothetical protein